MQSQMAYVMKLICSRLQNQNQRTDRLNLLSSVQSWMAAGGGAVRASDLKQLQYLNIVCRMRRGTCKFNGPSLFEKLKLCSVVSLPATSPLIWALTNRLLLQSAALIHRRETGRGDSESRCFSYRTLTLLPSPPTSADKHFRWKPSFFFAGWNINFL